MKIGFQMLETQVSPNMKEKIENIIIKNIPDAVCEFKGDSCNLKLQVSSEIFSTMTLINQHRTIMNLLNDEFKSGELHALSLETIVI